ncbi:MAG TPA: sigma-70 family RNA polymerase sigma factor [Oculatellaceae cyanobacterium]
MNSLNTAKSHLSVVQGAPSYGTMSDAELVMLCKQKDEKAFEFLVRRHQRTVYGLLLRLAPDWNDTADLAQEVFIRVWKGLDNLKNPHAFKSWLGQVATHLFYDELRKRPRRTPVISLDQSMFGDDEAENQTRDIADTSAGPEELFERKELDEEVRSAIATLPRQFRTAIVLRELEDMSYEQIAQLTNTDLGTVKSRISRARTKVQQVLRPRFGGERKSIA